MPARPAVLITNQLPRSAWQRMYALQVDRRPPTDFRRSAVYLSRSTVSATSVSLASDQE
jgi:hypothetical protein